MRAKMTDQGLTVHAIAGTYVVLLGFDMAEADCAGLRGFAIHRTDQTEGEAYWLTGMKTFEATDPGPQAGRKFSTRKQPIQSFAWGDYSAKPDHHYIYRVHALKGDPADLQSVAQVSVNVETESPEGGNHDIYFNRGSAASQEYAYRFKNLPPQNFGDAAFTWLSRGLWEAMVQFIADATGPEHELRLAAYEFNYPPLLDALREARDRGVTVRIVYDHRDAVLGAKNEAAAAAARITAECIQRNANPSAIAHNKFIVRLKNDQAEAVLTGGTNMSIAGILGHSNAVHVVEDPVVVGKYAAYWDVLKDDPEFGVIRPAATVLYDVPADLPPPGTGVVFSPRNSLQALDWYAHLASKAEAGLFMTFAFGMNARFQNIYDTSTARMRFALLDKPTSFTKPAERAADIERIRQLRLKPENRFAIGAHLTLNMFDRWLREQLTGLNEHVKYVHTKYMLIDPLGPDPIVVAGSANFSEASTTKNDENMLIIRGNKRVAEIYLGEFMRLYNHYAFREWASKQPPGSLEPKHLRTDDWWQDYFGDTDRSHQREYFAATQ